MTYLKWGSIAIAAIALIGLGWWLSSRVSAAKYEALQAQQSQLEAEASDARARALQGQILDLKATLANNQKVMNDYQNRAVSAESALDDAHSLLDLAARQAAAAGARVPKAGGGSGAPPARQAPSDDRLAGLLASAATECLSNADRLDALSAEIKPQL